MEISRLCDVDDVVSSTAADSDDASFHVDAEIKC